MIRYDAVAPLLHILPGRHICVVGGVPLAGSKLGFMTSCAGVVAQQIEHQACSTEHTGRIGTLLHGVPKLRASIVT